jgi:hypothetical protein
VGSLEPSCHGIGDVRLQFYYSQTRGWKLTDGGWPCRLSKFTQAVPAYPSP